MHRQRDNSEASEALQKARFVLVRQDGHKPPLVEAYRGPYKIKSRSDNSYLLEGGNTTEDWVAINQLKPFHVREGDEEIHLQPLPRRGRPVRVAGPASPRSQTLAYSPPEEDFPPLHSADTQPEAGTKLLTSSWTLENIQSLVSYLVLFYDSLMTFYLYFVYSTYFLLAGVEEKF